MTEKKTFVVFDDLGYRTREVQAKSPRGARSILGTTSRMRTIMDKSFLKNPDALTFNEAIGQQDT